MSVNPLSIERIWLEFFNEVNPRDRALAPQQYEEMRVCFYSGITKFGWLIQDTREACRGDMETVADAIQKYFLEAEMFIDLWNSTVEKDAVAH